MKQVLVWFLNKISKLFYVAHDFSSKIQKKIDPLSGFDLSKEDKLILNKNVELKNKFSNVNRCFILACGPSINTQDLKKLEGEFCITVSNFYIHPDFEIIKPKFHVFAPREPHMSAEYIGKLLEEFERHSDGETEAIISITDKDSVLKYKGLKRTKCYYYKTVHQFPQQLEYNFNFAKPIPLIQTVTHLALYHAINSGIKKIYLLGFDHDMILNLGACNHFYDEDKNEFIKDGRRDWENDVDLEVLGGFYMKVWKIYKQLNSYAKRNEISIVNLTAKTMLDVFPKDVFEDVLKNSINNSINNKNQVNN